MRSTTVVSLSLILTVGLGLAAWSPPGWAHGGKAPRLREGAALASGRYQLAKHWTGGEVRVLDRQTGRLFCLNQKTGEAILVDAIAGTTVTTLVQREIRAATKGPAAPTWPKRDATRGTIRFVGLGPDDPEARTLEAGVTPTTFDPDTGRIYRILSPVLVEILDPIEARITRSHLRLRDGTMLTQRMKMRRNEEQVIAGLQLLARAQVHFRDRDLDKDGKADFGTLKELGAAKLIAPSLATGTYHGYGFQLRLASEGTVFLAVAGPTEPGKSGVRHFAISERGVPYTRATAIPLDADCRIPDDAIKAGHGH